MVKFLEKSGLYSKIAKVSILLFICAVARGVKKKERISNALHGHFSYKMQRNVAKEIGLTGKERERSTREAF